ncbi:MAG: Tol-Pal system beta propeller repeat protein TolB [Nitrospirae bacterium]|nr:Tol-Pal system beta propeller repeat protein TolB [Nitrospirota bacterium]MCL5236569.1 Tol-Pal system beta propeller repeat protein TolB [Nitrospirota bacterium]
MREKAGYKNKNAKSRDLLFFIFSLATSCWLLVTSFADAKVYIDVTSPGVRKLPIAVQNFVGNKDISDIVKGDLDFTGLFTCIDEAAQVERPDQTFNPAGWMGIGVEFVVKGRVTASGKGLYVTISAYDVSDGREVLKKEYSSPPGLLRQLSHSVANDIYAALTGQQGIFRTKIAFVGEKGGKRELYLMDWDGYHTQGLNVTGSILLAPHWTSDKSKLLYSSERSRKWGLYILDMNTMKERLIVMLRGLNIAGNFFPGNKEFIFTSSKDGSPDIYIADSASIMGRKIISSPWIDVSPTVSPDGNSIAFVSNRSGGPQIYIADKNGNGIRRITFQGSYNTAPAWSPRGDRIVYTGMLGGKNQIFIVKPDGTGPAQLTDKGNNEDPCFSPDGRYIVFSSTMDGTKGLYIMRSSGEGLMRITPKGFPASRASWSPL